MFKKRSFFTFSLLISMSIILLLVYQNCGSLGAGSGKNIFDQCSFQNCNGQNINAMQITSTSAANSALSVSNIQDSSGSLIFNNINISGSCDTGGFSNVIVRGTVTGAQCFSYQGQSCTYTSPCVPTTPGSSTGTFSLQGYANLTNASYSLNLEIDAYNQYLQEMTGANSFYPTLTIIKANTPPPILCSNNCSSSIVTCMNSSAQNSWSYPSNISLNESATIYSSTGATLTGNNYSLSGLQGYCSPNQNVTVYIIPYGGSINSSTPSYSIPCNLAQGNVPYPTTSGLNGYFSLTSASLPLEYPQLWCPSTSSNGTNIPNCPSSLDQSSSRLSQVVVEQHSTSGNNLLSSRNVIFNFGNAAQGNFWDVNILKETLSRLASAFNTQTGAPFNVANIAQLNSAQPIYDRGTLGANANCSAGGFLGPQMYSTFAGSTCDGYDYTTSNFSNGTCFGPKSTYYFGIREWLVNYVLGYSGGENPNTACPNLSNSLLNTSVNIPLTGATDHMNFAEIAKNSSASDPAVICNLYKVVGNSNSQFYPMQNGSSVTDIEGQRIAACLTSRYLAGIWRAPVSYVTQFVETGVNCTSSDCHTCTFIGGATVNSTNHTTSDCQILANFYQAVEAIKTASGVGSVGSQSATSPSSSYQKFYEGLTQFYINMVMVDFYNMATGTFAQPGGPLFASLFGAAYPNFSMSDISSISYLIPKEQNYCINNDCPGVTIVPFGAMYDNNFPDGSYPNSLNALIHLPLQLN